MNSTLDTRSAFRLHTTLEREAERHWLLDFSAGRDFLALAAHKYKPDTRVSLLRRRTEDDPALDQMIDLLGLRSMAAPAGAWQQAVMSWHFTWEIVKLGFERSVRRAQNKEDGGSRG
ncbi:hypothetical protein [Curvibacter delicatus]|jgi:hypothetical protein|uniref:hypothetical protein n=1 Tax=Curvibacter delicatus TaxID=80879 RepID=UPI00082D228D|nr:hypothetical protein [Curvibacter delicatus]